MITVVVVKRTFATTIDSDHDHHQFNRIRRGDPRHR